MPKTKISEFSATPANNTDIDSINIAEGCAPSGINDAIRELMAQLKDFQTGAVGDSFNGPIGATTASTGAFTTLSASSTTTLSGLTASTALALDASKNVVSVTNTGSGNNVLSTSPTLVTPILGTPTSATLTNATGLPISTGVSGLGTGVATFLATPSSANLRSALTDETGTGSAVFATSPTLVTPALGTPSSVTLTNATGLPNAGLINSSITIGGTAIALGASSNTLANDITVYGLTVGRGGGAVSTNTAVGSGSLATNSAGVHITSLGYEAGKDTTASYGTFVGGLAGNLCTTGTFNTVIGFNAFSAAGSGERNGVLGAGTLSSNTSGSNNTAIGMQALQANTSASNNTALGYQAGYLNQTGTGSVFIGYQAGYTSAATSTNGYNVCVGVQAGYALTTGVDNTFVGGSKATGSGSAITSGSKNTILGSYSGNQGSLDIRTASNYIVLSDGDGNPRGIYNSSGAYWDLQARTVLSGANNGNVAELIWTRTDASYMWANQTTMRLYGQAANTTNPNTKLLETQAGSSLAIGGASTQAGSGITFPATQSASSNANTLDDYEEGTWTPSQGGGLTVVGTFSSSGTYTKIGRFVYVKGSVNGSTSIAVAAGSIITGNLPFSATNQGTGTAVNAPFNVGSVAAINALDFWSMSAIGASSGIVFSGSYAV